MSAFRRKENRASYRRNFFFVTEGVASEQAYLKIVWNRLQLRERCTPRYCHRNSGIPAMLTKAREVEEGDLFKPGRGDEIWIILDHDEQSHFPEQFESLAEWEDQKPYRHVAISSPRFEFWLLLHVDEQPHRDKCKSDDYMQQRIPNFKNLPIGTTAITADRIRAAMKRALCPPMPNCRKPSVVGSGLGLLIQRLLTMA